MVVATAPVVEKALRPSPQRKSKVEESTSPLRKQGRNSSKFNETANCELRTANCVAAPSPPRVVDDAEVETQGHKQGHTRKPGNKRKQGNNNCVWYSCRCCWKWWEGRQAGQGRAEGSGQDSRWWVGVQNSRVTCLSRARGQTVVLRTKTVQQPTQPHLTSRTHARTHEQATNKQRTNNNRQTTNE